MLTINGHQHSQISLAAQKNIGCRNIGWATAPHPLPVKVKLKPRLLFPVGVYENYRKFNISHSSTATSCTLTTVEAIAHAENNSKEGATRIKFRVDARRICE